MWSLVRTLLMAASMVAGQLSAGMTLKAIRTDPDGKQVEVEIPPVQLDFDPFPAQISSTFQPRQESHHITPRDDPAEINYSRNWCGARAHTPPENPVVYAKSKFTVPRLGVHVLEPLPQAAGAWLGLGGDTCQDHLFQLGISAVINTTNGQTWQKSYLFLRMYPGFYYQLDESISPDDEFEVIADLTNSTWLEIVTKDFSKSGTSNFSNTTFNVSLPILPGFVCGGDVEWVVSNTQNGTYALSYFSDIKFYQSIAMRKDGSILTIKDANLTYMEDAAGNLKCTAQRGDDPGELGITRQG